MTHVVHKGSLTIVGTGISVASQATLETVATIQDAEQVFYLVIEPATAAWIRRLNPTATTLDDLYAEGKSRRKTYVEMTDRLVGAVRAGRRVCAAFYGHPGVFVNASHSAMRRLRREGYPVRMLPGISAEDCLFADLGVNPGDHGCQSFEATDFLAARRRFDPRSELILWQLGALGEGSVRPGIAARPERLRRLVKALRRHYPSRHRIVLYEAPCFPGCVPIIRRMPLSTLPEAEVHPMVTMYVPPLPQRISDPTIIRWFDEAAPTRNTAAARASRRSVLARGGGKA
jgi:precorrin-6B methylase 1